MKERIVVGTLVYQERNQQAGFELYESASISDIFSDGVSQALFGSATCRLLFHRVESTYVEDGLVIERRKSVAALVLPTPALLQICVTVLEQTANSASELNQSLDALKTTITQISDSHVRSALAKKMQSPGT